MGRVKTLLVKRETHKLMELYGDRFTDSFEKNKKVVDALVSTPSKKLRNIIAGYATRIVKKKQESEHRGKTRERLKDDDEYGGNLSLIQSRNTSQRQSTQNTKKRGLLEPELCSSRWEPPLS